MATHGRFGPGLNLQILIAAVAGLALGYGLNGVDESSSLRSGILYGSGLMATLFIDLLKMVLIPLVFTSIVVGVASLQEHHQASRVWKLTLGVFVLTTTCAMALALVVTGIVEPGRDLSLDLFADSISRFEARQMPGTEILAGFLHSLFMNPLAALADGKILPVVVFALCLGVALVQAGNRSSSLLTLLREVLELLMRMVNWIMRLAPPGVFALLVKLMATQNLDLLATMAEFILLVFAITLVHGAVVLPGILWLFTRRSPLWLWRGARPALITAFATSSSSATLPVTLQCAEQLQVRKEVAGFVLPLGATMNMDGTALYEASAALFIAWLAGIDLSLGQQLVVMLTAMVASMGAPGIPSAGMVTMVMVLQAVGLPAEAIAILLPIDRILDTIRTAVNVEGDMVTSIVVDQLSGPQPH